MAPVSFLEASFIALKLEDFVLSLTFFNNSIYWWAFVLLEE